MADLYIISSPIFTEFVLPFLLVFVLIYAILQKSKILGENNATLLIVSLVIGLIFVSFSQAVNLTIQLMALMAVVAMIFLVFLILYGMVATGKEGLDIHKSIKITAAVLALLILVVGILVFTDYWQTIFDFFTTGNGQAVLMNLIFVAIIVVAIIVVLKGKA